MIDRKVTKEIGQVLCWVPGSASPLPFGSEIAHESSLRKVGYILNKEAAERLAWFEEHYQTAISAAGNAEHVLKEQSKAHAHQMRIADEKIGRLTRELASVGGKADG